MDPNAQPQQQPGPGGAGAPQPGQQPGGDPGAQIQQLAQQYVAQGRPPEMAVQGFDLVCSAMGLDGAPAGDASGGAPGGAGAPPAGGGGAGAPPSMKKGGKFNFTSKGKKSQAAPASKGGMPTVKVPGKK